MTLDFFRSSAWRFGLAGACCVVLPACADTVPTNTVKSTDVKVQPRFVSNTIDPDRKDTPWAKLNDAQLAAEIRKWEGRVLIGFKDVNATDGVDNYGKVLASEESVVAAKRMLRGLGVEVTYEFKKIPAVAANISAELVSEIRRHPNIDYLEPSAGEGRVLTTPAPTPPAPLPFSQVTPYGITNVGALSAHAYTTGYGVKVLIMDTGTDIYHADLYSRSAWRCVNSAYPIVDDMGHGTHVTGIAAALNNSSDVIGVAPDLYLMSANVFIGVASIPAEVACSIDVARLNSVAVANMSFSLSTSTAVTDEINGGYNFDNMLFVGAAGNNNFGSVIYPASLSNVIAVSAVDSTNTIASFSNIGSKIEMTAPGVDVLSTAWTGGYACANGTTTALCSGTSMAAPHVTGALALIKAYNPTWTNAQVRSRLTSTAYDLGLYGRDVYYGFGLVNLAGAIP